MGRVRAQRRPGREPRRHALLGFGGASNAGRSTKAGARTPATPCHPATPTSPAVARSTKAGARTPATPRGPRGAAGSTAALNEGRGANPGDTRPAVDRVLMLCFAQRRPGREPRRHSIRVQGSRAYLRLAQRRPGREPRRHSPSTAPGSLVVTAQRRPGREPRRHAVRPLDAAHALMLRSTKAGARTPATPAAGRLRQHVFGEPLNEGRGANPGDTGVARRHRPSARDALNEGRGANPGDTRPPRCG